MWLCVSPVGGKDRGGDEGRLTKVLRTGDVAGDDRLGHALPWAPAMNASTRSCSSCATSSEVCFVRSGGMVGAGAAGL